MELFQELEATETTLDMVEDFEKARTEEPKYQDFRWMTDHGGAMALANAIFGDGTFSDPHDTQKFIDCTAALRIIDDFQDLEEDREHNKDNYFLNSNNPKPIEFWIRLYKQSVKGMKNEKLKAWCAGWDNMYAIERAFKPGLKKEYELAEQRALVN